MLVFYLPDASGLIRWLLMVNPSRRATLEDVVSHWWVNWGYTTRIGEQEEAPTSSDSGRASMADWLRRSSRPVCSFFRQHAGASTGLERQHSLKKSRKEHDMAPPHQGPPVSNTSHPSKSDLKQPKGILKKVSAPLVEARGDTERSSGQAIIQPPRKGILRNTQQRESGYYSSPEPSDSGELLDRDNVLARGTAVEQKPLPDSGPLLHRKGILKHNGKFSRTTGDLTVPPTFGSLDELAASHPPARASRPMGAMSEESILSSESFDQLDLPERLPGAPLRGCVSVDDLLCLEEPPSDVPGSRTLRRWRQDPLGDSCLSLLECQEVTEAYRQALKICTKLS